jgi:flagellar biosynthesis protein FliQ
MTPEDITDLIRYTIFIAAQISAPILFILMTIGLSVAVFQSVTQISETTMVFIPKLFAFTLVVSMAFPWMLKIMMRYTTELYIHHWNKIITLSSYAL